MEGLAKLVQGYVGKEGTILVERKQILVYVTVKDVRQSFGRTEFLVRPTYGEGDAWVSSWRVLFGRTQGDLFEEI